MINRPPEQDRAERFLRKLGSDAETPDQKTARRLLEQSRNDSESRRADGPWADAPQAGAKKP